MRGFIEALQPWMQRRDRREAVVDLGCGEGTFGEALFSETADRFCGIDLSKRAMKLASRNWPDATWVLCNADRTLPMADQTVGCVTSLFGRRPASEIARVLALGGLCVIAVPGEEDLIELREQVQQESRRRSRWRAVADELTDAGLTMVDFQQWRHRVHLDRPAIADALAMTYRAVRRSEQSRLESIEATEVTLDAEMLLLRRE